MRTTNLPVAFQETNIIALLPQGSMSTCTPGLFAACPLGKGYVLSFHEFCYVGGKGVPARITAWLTLRVYLLVACGFHRTCPSTISRLGMTRTKKRTTRIIRKVTKAFLYSRRRSNQIMLKVNIASAMANTITSIVVGFPSLMIRSFFVSPANVSETVDFPWKAGR